MLRYVPRPGERCWFERPEGMPPLLHRLLIQRGVDSPEAAEAFLHPGVEQLHDPLLLRGMKEAVDAIRRAMDAGERICVYGDYDVDGVCASAILYDYLTSEGARAEVYLPSRHDEGYGLNEAAVREIAQRAELLVTVDCGIASAELIELAKELGLRCVVTDHHRPGERIPDCAVIDPLLGDYPFRWLCGAGVAFKLVSALGGLDAGLARIDLAAIATVADIVSLTGENRAIVKLGLDSINRRPRPGVAALMERARVEPGQLTSQGIAFRLAPRLNAGGRLGSARRSFELLIQPEEFLAVALADELEEENARRREVEREIRASAEGQLEELDFSAHRVLMARGEGWNPGVIGLAAGHLREKYGYPVIVLSESDGMLTGSCRSIPGVDIYQTLCAGAELMERFGGHSQAAGLTLRAENFDALWARLDAYLFEHAPADAWVPSASYDLDAPLDELTEEFVGALDALEPTGCGNPEPVFRARVQLIEARPIGSQGAHLRLICAGNGARRTGIYFGAGALAGSLGESADVLFTPQINRWNGRTDVQLKLCALREADDAARIEAAREREGSLQRRFLTELLYNRRESCSAAAPEIELGELRRRLENPQGALILCAGLDLAGELLAELEALPLDLHIGAVPRDARGFNALAVWPEALGEYPRALRTLVLAGLPAPDAPPPGVELRSLNVEGGLRGALPDVARMRAVYVAARNLSRRPIRLSDIEALDARLSEETGLPPTCCHASLLALLDMKLVELRTKPFALSVPRAVKTDPESSAVWRAIECLGKRFGALREEEQVEGGSEDDGR